MKGYTNETAVQILIALLKKHGIRRGVISPGTTNVSLVASLQQDPFFELKSCVDERSAAYMACGLAAETGEPVFLSCTGATASRNYIPGLTEAYYRDLPVLAITASQHHARAGQMSPQMLDRTVQLNDMVRKSVQVPAVHTDEDRWGAVVAINDAIAELTRNGCGPVHINYVTEYSKLFDVDKLPDVRCIKRVNYGEAFPAIPAGRIAIFVGAHFPFNEKLTALIDSFCETYDAVVLCDQTSNYHGRYRVLGNLLAWQDQYATPLLNIDLLVHIGAISGSYMKIRPKEVWRVHPRGDIQDAFDKLTHVFQMREESFFTAYAKPGEQAKSQYLNEIDTEIISIRNNLPELPFSHVWCAQQTAPLLPSGSTLYLGILNSLRCWNLFETPSDTTCFSNTGGFGIDGGVSSLIGASFANTDKLYYGVVGDLGFFYDMNSIGNRHVGPNVRLIVVNNGRGTEFRNYWHRAAAFGDEADLFMAAGGHFGRQSPDLVRHYASDLGFEYLAANNKNEYLSCLDHLTDSKIGKKPILLEVFTDSKLESDALYAAHNVKTSASGAAKQKAKEILGPKGIKIAKRIFGR